MKYLLILATLLYAALAPSETLAQRLAQLSGDPDVIGAHFVYESPQAISGLDLHTQEIEYYGISGDSARLNKVRLVGINHGEQTEAWYWLGVPSELTNNPPVYMAGHSQGPFDKAQVEWFANERWVSQVSGAAPIQNFTAKSLGPLSVLVSGLFNTPADTVKWKPLSFLLRYPSPSTNWEQVIAELAEVE